MFGLRKLFGLPPSKDTFAKKIIGKLREQLPDRIFQYDKAGFRIHGSDGWVAYLDNVFLDYSKAQGKEREKTIEGFLAGMMAPEIPANFSEAQQGLLPVIRHVSGLEIARLESQGQVSESIYSEFPMRPLSQELAIAVAFDSEHSVQQIGKNQLAEWGKSIEELVDIAIANLRDKSAPKFEAFAPGFYVSQYGDFYDAARLLLPEVARQLPLKGRPVAMIPNRTALLLTGDRDEYGLAELIALAEKVLLEDSRPLGSEMFVLEDKTWEVWQPNGANGDRLHNLQLQMLASDYSAQKGALEAQMLKSGTDIFVASFKLLQFDGKSRFVSSAVLSKGVDTLLPKSEEITLYLPDSQESFTVPWATFEQHAGYLMEQLPLNLVRYRVKDFPSESVLNLLREMASAPVSNSGS